MEFVYFKAPYHAIKDLVSEKPASCSLCGKPALCFKLDGAICLEFDQAELKTKIGCYDCLRVGRFEFSHDTEAGFLDEAGFHHSNHETGDRHLFVVDPAGTAVFAGQAYVAQAPTFEPPTEALTELRRTPNFQSWQEPIWLVHCNNFMVYLGEWKPQDFIANALDGDGRNLFLAITEYDPANLELWPEDKLLPQWDSVGYYAFKCLHCNLLRGYWDYD